MDLFLLSNQLERATIHTAQRQYDEAMWHLRKARGLLGGLLCALGDDLGDRACLEGCFDGLAEECAQMARHQLGLRARRR